MGRLLSRRESKSYLSVQKMASYARTVAFALPHPHKMSAKTT